LPNIVVVYADDLGYADLGCFGAEAWKTPHLDAVAKSGIRFTDFHVSQPVCSASRCSLLTGCYANRLGIHGALGPNSRVGISDKELTLAELCKQKGYATAMVGKWHLGHLPPFLPTKHGFDSYFGLPYSNDMWPFHPEAKAGTYPPLPLFENDRIINANVTAEDQAKLTQQYTDRAVKFIAANKAKPFFLYVAHSMPHVPIFAGAKFAGQSKSGTYGDVIQELDASVGAIVAELRKQDIEKNTLLIFTSDNGPWLSYGNHAGSAGPLREGKGTSWEGGVRVPFVAQWPGRIPAGSTQHEPAMTIDLLPTVAKIIGGKLPDHPIDGRDILPLLKAQPGAKCPHEAYFHYYNQNELQAVRSGQWKLVFPHTYRTMQGQEPGKDGKPGRYKQLMLESPELYDLKSDIGETKNVATLNPDIVKKLQALAETARKDMGDNLTKTPGNGSREPGRLPLEKK
jgi:arylsulfatase A-like enzyme